MLAKKTICYVGLSEKAVQCANKLQMSDKTIINHFRSTKREKWKMSTEEWIKKLYQKKYKADQ
mgnify:CR=1